MSVVLLGRRRSDEPVRERIGGIGGLAGMLAVGEGLLRRMLEGRYTAVRGVKTCRASEGEEHRLETDAGASGLGVWEGCEVHEDMVALDCRYRGVCSDDFLRGIAGRLSMPIPAG